MIEYLHDEQWELIEPYIPPPPRRADGRGRPWSPARPILAAIFWLLHTGARWQDLPDCYPPPTTCFRRFQVWVEQGLFLTLAREFANALWVLDDLDLSECFIDAPFTPANTGGDGVGKTKRGNSSQVMIVTDRAGLPVSAYV